MKNIYKIPKRANSSLRLGLNFIEKLSENAILNNQKANRTFNEL